METISLSRGRWDTHTSEWERDESNQSAGEGDRQNETISGGGRETVVPNNVRGGRQTG